MTGTTTGGPQPLGQLDGLRTYRKSPLPHCVDLFLDGNEGTLSDPCLLRELADPEMVRRYPSARALERELAARHDVDPDRLLVTAGGDEGLDRVFRAYLGPGRNLVLPEPTFEMLPRYAALAGAELRSVPWSAGAFPVDAVLKRSDAATAAVFVVSPNNPTGAVASASDLLRLSRALPRALLVVDHAYAEFADEDLTSAALALPNAVVVRTLSKAWGLAGLRVGFVLGPPAIVAELRKAASPYSVAGPSLALARAAVARGDDAVRRFVSRVRDERELLSAQLDGHGFAVAPSQANFVLASGRRARWLADALRSLGIAVRTFPDRPELEDAVRISCPGDATTFARLARSIDTACSPEAVLFDLDGVLADVSGSYRRAIRETAAAFGVTVADGDVRAVKASGDANNDWVVTHRLLAARGVEIPLEQVTLRFEALYQGTDGRPGLWATERPLLARATLQRWSRSYRLGIVTGRPRADAERFLDEHDLFDLFEVLVCLEDAARKPDPAPVRLALTKLGVERALFVGDTRDDLTAARAAGTVGVGVLAPGEPRDTSRALLFAHGAARVLDGPDQLGELLP